MSCVDIFAPSGGLGVGLVGASSMLTVPDAGPQGSYYFRANSKRVLLPAATTCMTNHCTAGMALDSVHVGECGATGERGRKKAALPLVMPVSAGGQTLQGKACSGQRAAH